MSLTAALLTAAVLGMCFNVTRWLGIGACALLTLLYPWLAVLILIGSAAVFYRIRIHK